MFSNDDKDFLLTTEEGKAGLKRGAMTGLYVLLFIVVIVTGTHAVMLVLSQAPEPTSAENGLLTAVLNGIRVSFPITMELAAIVAGLGFIAAKWRKGQKTVAFGIEACWVIFAAANMITFFRVERGLPLESWQTGWINYGLPLTSLIAGILTYGLTRADPDLKRKDEETAAQEKITMIRFGARRDVEISPQRQAIEKQRAWIDFVKELRSAGYTELQIRYMLQDTPELLIDHDKDGRLDLLEDAAPHQQLPAPPPNAPRQSQPGNGVPRRMATTTPPLPTETDDGDGADRELRGPFFE